MSITKIALTGGPCGGKSTGIAILEQELTDKGYTVIVIEEIATQVIKSGLSFKNLGGYEFQRVLMQMQYNRDKTYEKAAERVEKLEDKDVIIIYDRGIPDGKAFVTNEEYTQLLKDLGLSETKARDYYDGVFHLVTAADGAPEAYTLENNKARTETPEQAIERDKGCLRAYTGHPHLRVIKNGCTFKEKIDNLLKEVYALLGIPVPIEIERKYLVEKVDIAKIKEKYACTTVNIIQTYLVEKELGVERRVRQRGVDGSYTFYYTEKTKLNDLSRIEKEKKISEEEYLALLMEADTNLHQIRKNRTCFVHDGNYFELDEYLFWDDKAVLEIELTDENKEVTLPEEIKLIKEVTEDERYKNKSLAKNLGNTEK